MPVPVYSDCVVYLRNLVSKGSKQVSGHMQFSQTINLICRYTSPECTCLHADLPTDSSHKLYNRFSHDEDKNMKYRATCGIRLELSFNVLSTNRN